MATHSCILPWRLPWREEPGRLQSMGRRELDMTEQLHSLTYSIQFYTIYKTKIRVLISKCERLNLERIIQIAM